MNQSNQITGGRVRPKASAAFVAALVVALVGAASPAAAQDCAPTGGEASANVICGTVTNSDGSPVPNVPVGTNGGAIAFTDPNGFFIIESVPPGTHIVSVDTSALPPGSVVTPPTREVTVTLDPMGNPTATPNQDFEVSEEQQPGDIWGVGTGTPGYWKNHPEAWPAAGISVGGVNYVNNPSVHPNIWDAIAKMGKVGGDKTLTIFASLISAKLNLPLPNNPACISATIALADAWMIAHPVGSNVKASSAAWAEAQEWHQKMDDYNNGKLCAPHRD